MSRDRNPRNGFIKVLAVISGLIFVTSLAVHIATFAPHPKVYMESTWFIHLAIFVPFGCMVVVLSARQREESKGINKSLTERIGERYAEAFGAIGRVVRMMPTHVLMLGIVLLIYVPINFLLFINHTWKGSPIEDRGRYYLSDHVTYVRELTRAEYDKYQAYVVRGFSGHWMVFSFLPLVYFLFVHDKVVTRPSSDVLHSGP